VSGACHSSYLRQLKIFSKQTPDSKLQIIILFLINSLIIIEATITTAFKIRFTHLTNWKGWSLNNQLVITNFDGSSDKGMFLRPVIDISRQFQKMNNWRIGAKYASERNSTRFKSTDTLTPLSFSYDSYSLYMRSDENKKNRYGISFFYKIR
jgi:hypothetical protein